MSRSKSTILNILVFGTKYIVFSLLSFFVSQQILIVYGSSVNGVVAAATQIMALLFILEGGFTTATVTALYKPYVEQDYTEYNIIISTTCKAFRKIACLTLLIGLPVSFLYPLFLKTELSYIKCSIIFGLICFTTAINFYFFQVRQIMFHVAQKEFIPQTIAMICTSVAQLLMVLVIFLKQDILIVRGVVALMLTISGISVCLLAKRFFSFVNLQVPVQGRKIHGTSDTIVSNVVSAIYKAAPVFIIATFFGTREASIYSIYYMIFGMISIVLYSISLSLKSAFGQLFHTSDCDRKKFNDLFQLFETGIMTLAVAALITCANTILPFMMLYTAELPDTAAYQNPVYVLFFCLLTLTQIIHIPSGLMLQVSGRFKTARDIQLVTLFSMFAISGIGGILFGIVGMLFGLVGANCLLASCEIGYTYHFILKEKIFLIVRKLLILLLCGGTLLIFEHFLLPPMKNWSLFFCFTAVTGIINLFVLSCLAFYLFPKTMRSYLRLRLNQYTKCSN